MNQLKKYIVALTNLYGFVHKEKVMTIYNSQNTVQIKMSDIDQLLNNLPKDLEQAFVMTHGEYFLHEVILEFDEFNILLNKKKDKPHYIPNKNELLKYVDEDYFEKTKAYNKLLNYVKKNFFNGNQEKAEYLLEDIHDTLEADINMQMIFDIFNNQGISFNDMEQANEVIGMIMTFANNIRIWENNGHTPHEIFETYEKPNLKPLPDKVFEIKREKVGRNDPCPCGSGKKYKKCCLKK